MHLAKANPYAEAAPIRFMDLQLGNRVDPVDSMDQVVDFALPSPFGTVFAYNHKIRGVGVGPLGIEGVAG